ncbi:MAG: D-glycero-alpha-D-manno-heptose-1,7-bisphosphate 7-phosphatase [Candidatus Hydrothermia bacterium]
MRAFFFDRDGTIIVNKHYLSTPLGIRFLPCAFDVLRLIQSKGFKLFLITNQSGVKRGYYSKDRIELIHREITLRLMQEKIFITEIAYCEHHPAERCPCRKPDTLMLKRLLRKYNINPSESYMVGDRKEDIVLGKKFNMKTIFLSNISPLSTEVSPDYFICSLCEIPELLNG